ncbi:hypothetical protein VTO42DRAFT_5213 [Malbranchea cinnamomea]
MLLLPSLSILTFLSKPGRSIFFNVDRNPILHAILKRTFYDHFCSGENEAQVASNIRQLKALGLRGVILTYAREIVFDTRASADSNSTKKRTDSPDRESKHCPDIEEWIRGALKTLHLLEENDYLALKLTGAGIKAAEAFAAGELPPRQMMEALHEMCALAKQRKVRILVDAESQRFQRGIARVALELMRKYNRDGKALVFNTYQAYLKNVFMALSADLDAASHEGFTLGVKLVRGAYITTEKRSLIHDTKQETDNAFDGITRAILKQELGEFGRKLGRPFPSVNLFIASHNKASVLAAHELHQQRLEQGLPTVPVQYAQLMGMADEVTLGLLQLTDRNGVPPEVYKCSTWGKMGDCVSYLVRRAVENRDAVSRTESEYAALKAEVMRRIKAVSFPVSSKS